MAAVSFCNIDRLNRGNSHQLSQVPLPFCKISDGNNFLCTTRRSARAFGGFLTFALGSSC